MIIIKIFLYYLVCDKSHIGEIPGFVFNKLKSMVAGEKKSEEKK